MTQNEKDILLKDLCARLPYGVKVRYSSYEKFITCTLQAIDYVYNNVDLWSKDACFNPVNISKIKPYLFPLSSMTNELWDKEFMGCGITEFTRDSFKYGCETLDFSRSNPNLSSMVRFINQLIKNHFDIYGLIPMGLAIDATGLNIY